MKQVLISFFALLLLSGCVEGAHQDESLFAPTVSVQSSARPIQTFTSTPVRTSTPTLNPHKFNTYYGIWTITSYEQHGLSAFLTDEYAESQIGKKVELTSAEMQFDNDFLWLSDKYCANASYEWATSEQFVGNGWQGLLPFENPEKREELLFLNSNCDGKMITGFEVSRTGNLIVYYDGYWFFLCPEMSAASALATRSAITFTPSLTPSPLPKNSATVTATLQPTQFYEKYYFDWLIAQERDANRGNTVQSGAEPLFVSGKYPDTYVDLDMSAYSERRDDLKFSMLNGVSPLYYLAPVNDTKFIPAEYSNASLETCTTADYSMPLDFIDLEIEKGSYYCAMTSDQRFSLFHIDKVDHLGDGSLRISFVTLKKESDE